MGDETRLQVARTRGPATGEAPARRRVGQAALAGPPGRADRSALEQGVATHQDVLSLQTRVGNRAVQRTLARPSAPIQRKLSFENTQWAKAQYLDASSGGGGGVLFVGEKGREIVVKPGEEKAAEGALAALLQSEVAKSGKQTLALAPGLRVVAPDEAKQIKSALEPLVGQAGANAPDEKGRKGKKFLNERAQELVGKLTEPGVVVQDMASGGEMKDVMKGVAKHTKKSLFGERKLRKESPLRIFKDVRSIRALGSVTAVDLFMGNRDRLFMYNAENFMVTPYSLTMIDNIWMGTDMSNFQKSEVEGRDGQKFTITADEALASWKADPQVKELAAGQYGAISAMIWDRILDEAVRDTRKTDRTAFRKLMKGYESRFLKTFSEGLAEGKQKLIASLTGLLKKPDQLQKLVPGVDLQEIMATIRKRRDFLQGQV